MLKYIFAALLIAAVWGVVLWLEFPWWIAAIATFVIVAIVVTIVIVKIVRAKRAANEIEKALKAQGDQHAASVRPDLKADVDAMQNEFNKAVVALKSSKLGKRPSEALYALPWYMIIGPPGAGKSTAIRNSGLRFPYLSERGRGGIKGVGGTRNCEWWMTNDAVILDTAGRYTTEDDDRDEWFSFLELLKKNRPKRPINGVMVAVSIADLAMAHEETIASLAKDIRARIDEVMGRLEMVVPVYVLFTKCDLLPGFVEIFGDLGSNERRQIWGFTIPLAGKADPADVFVEHFSELANTIERRALRRMGDDRRANARDKIYEFPQYFEPLKQSLGMFVGELLAENIYHESPIMRGVYFTSGTQEGRPIDRIMGAMAQAFGIQPRLTTAEPVTEAKSYFLGDLFSNVVFPDRDIARRSAARMRRQRIIGYAAAGVTFLAAVGLAVLPVLSFQRNRDLLSGASEAIDRVSEHHASNTVDPIAIENIEPLRAFERLIAGYQADGPPFNLRMGMYQGETVYPPVSELYTTTVRKELLEPIVTADVGQLKRFSARYAHRNAQAPQEEHRKTTDMLRMYLLLTAPKEEGEPGIDEKQRPWLVERIVDAWAEPLKLAGDRATRGSMSQVADTYAAILAQRTDLMFERDTKMVESVRRILRRTDRTNTMLERLIAEVEGVDLTLRDMVTAPCIQNENRKVRAAFTRKGWEEHVRERLAEPPDDLAGEEWVLGRTSEDASEAREKQLTELRSQYFDRYVKEWQKFLGAVYVDPPGNYLEALTMMQDLTRGATPAFGSLLAHVDWNTHLAEAKAEPEEEEEGGLLEEVKEQGGKQLGKKGKLGKAAKAGAKLLDRPEKKAAGAGIYFTAATVRDRFKPLARFGVPKQPPPQEEGGPPPPPPEAVALDTYQEQLVAVRDALQATIDDPAEGANLVKKLQAARNRVTGVLNEYDAGEWNTLLKKILWPPIDATWNLAGKSAADDLQKAWCNDIVTPWESTLSPRYPFKSTGYDVTIADFTKFFKPESGTIWQYHASVLSGRIPLRGERYELAAQGAASRTKFQPSIVPFLNSARDLGRVMFPAGAATPLVEFDVMILGTPKISEISLTVDGTALRYRNGPLVWERLKWPGEEGKPGATIRAKGFGINGRVEQEGEWGFFRLLEQGRLVGGADKRVFTMKWDLTDQGAGVITIKLRPTRGETPFFGVPGRGTKFMRVFRSKQLRIPRSIVVGGPGCQVGGVGG